MMPRRPNHYQNMVRRLAVGARDDGDTTPAAAESNTDPTYDRSIHEIFGRLRVSTKRQYVIEVKHEFNSFAPGVTKPMHNPVNQCGPLIEEQVPVATGNDFESFMAAFNKRCNFLATDDIDDQVFLESLSMIAAMPNLFDDQPWDDNELDRARWASKFDHHKQARMAAAYDTIPSCTPKYLGEKDLSVKQEILLKRNDPTFAPRIIYAGNDAFNTVTGPASMVAMERLCTLFDHAPLGPVHYKFAYKTDDVQLATYLTSDNTLKYTAEGDYSANDREQRPRVHLIYDAYLQKVNMPNWFRHLLKCLETFKVKSRQFGIRAEISHQLPTGTTSTTPRNSVYNATMFSVSCARQKTGGKGVVLGDDLLAVLFAAINCSKWAATVALFRMVLKASTPKLNCDATFLSKRLILSGSTPCMLPKLGKAIARFNARGIMCDAVTSSQYMAGKALSYAYEFRHVPFMRDFFLERYSLEDSSALRLDDLTWTARTCGVTLRNIASSIADEPCTISDDLFRDWLMEAYDVGLDDLDCFCTSILLSSAGSYVSCVVVDGLSRDW
jgi:hypothetical protein